MNKLELSRIISPEHITYDELKQTLLSSQNTEISKSFVDGSLIFVEVVLFANQGNTVNLASNEFLILLSVSQSTTTAVNEPYSYNLENNIVAVLGSSLGSIFIKDVTPQGFGLGFATFLKFKVV